jgi:hypothetical protein
LWTQTNRTSGISFVIKPSVCASAVKRSRANRCARSSAATCGGCWLDDGKPFALGLVRLDGLDDRAMHPVRDLVGELDADLLKARSF